MTQSNQYLGFDDKWFRLIGVPVSGLIIPPIFFQEVFHETMTLFCSTIMCVLFTCIDWQFCRYIFIKGNQKFPHYSQNRQRLIWIMSLCFAFILSFGNIFHLILEPLIGFNKMVHRPSLFQVNAASVFSFIVIAGVYESMRNFSLWKKTSLEKEQLIKENIQSQLEGLKNQVNPHFLFNSLNTLVNIIPEHPETAVRFVQKLSKVYRYILEIRDTQTTPLSNELDFIKAYMFLLKERFGDNISVKITPNTEGVYDREMVPLSLQILFENAIKHNIISTAQPLLIEVLIENERLIVKNNLQRKNQVQEGTEVGLQNIKNRYRLICNKEVDIIVTQQSFMVALPLLKATIETIKSTEIINNL